MSEFCIRTPPGRIKDFDLEFAGIDKPANIASFIKSKMHQQFYHDFYDAAAMPCLKDSESMLMPEKFNRINLRHYKAC